MKLAIFLKVAYFLTVILSFLFINKTLLLISLKARTAINAKVSMFVICAEMSIYLLSHNLHGCTFNNFCFTCQITPEVVAPRCSVKKLFVEFLQNSRENTDFFYRSSRSQMFFQTGSQRFRKIHRKTPVSGSLFK